MALPLVPLLAVAIISNFIAPAFSASSSCSTTLTPTNSVKPTVASGYQAQLIATGLTSPRSIQFDANGNLLVVEVGVGITNLAFKDNGGTCLEVSSRETVVRSSQVRSLSDSLNSCLTLCDSSTMASNSHLTGRPYTHHLRNLHGHGNTTLTQNPLAQITKPLLRT
jgi:hypothetical protein